MSNLVAFIKHTVVSPQGLPAPSRSDEQLVADLDERMRTLEVLTWTIVPIAGAVGLHNFRRLAGAGPETSAARLLTRSTICTWSLITIAMSKLWHARAQEHTELMKELVVTRASQAMGGAPPRS